MAAQEPITAAEEKGTAEEAGAQVNQFEFIDRVPTVAEVRDLLLQLPDVFGVSPADYVEYVQPLGQKKKIKVGERDKYIYVYTLYFTVAGRMAMLREATEINDWTVDFRPEMTTPTGTPGFIDLGVDSKRIIYREYLVIEKAENAEWTKQIGSKPGQAWVPFSGGSQAKGTNPYEKVETAARGRAIAAWGFGVIPGSGVASLEEMLGVDQNAAGMAASSPRGANDTRRSREDLLSGARLAAEKLRLRRNMTQEQMADLIGKYLIEIGAPETVWNAEKHHVDWTKATDGHLALMEQSLAQHLQSLDNEEGAL